MTQIFGHRGASGYAPENTLEAFDLAVRMGADGVELDVQLTKDGQVVVIHDELIDRTSDHKGKVMDYTLDELRSFNFNNHNPDYPYCRIPTLEEVIELLKPAGLQINIELKTGIFPYEGIEEKVLALVEKHDMKKQVIYSSFNHYTMQTIRQLDPEAYCGMLHEDKMIDIADYACFHRMNALHPILFFLLDERYLKDARDHGLDINSWTINEPEHIALALQKDINILITNYPDRALKIREEMKKNPQ